MSTLNPNEIRDRLQGELDQLDLTGNLAPAALAQGRTRRRRRRAALATTALAAAAVGGTLLANTALGGGEGDPARDGDLVATAPSSAPAVDPAAEALADGSVSTKEWNEVLRATFEQLLPDRYGAVRTMEYQPHRLQQFATAGGKPRLQLDLTVQGRQEDAENDPSDWSCAAQDAARGLLDCAEAELGNGWFAVATSERTAGDAPNADGGADTYGTALLVMNEGVWVELGAEELGWDGLQENGEAGITPQELIAMAQDPALLRAVEAGVTWQEENWETEMRRDLGTKPGQQSPPVAIAPPFPYWPGDASGK